jgi:hypothetical protein
VSIVLNYTQGREADLGAVLKNQRIVNKFFKPKGVYRKDMIGPSWWAAYSAAGICVTLRQAEDVRRQDETAGRFSLIFYGY